MRFLLLFLLFMHGRNAYSQLCQGSLGDPVVNITFGAGSNPGGALAAAGIGYQYVATDCPDDGYYTVRNNTTSCFGNTWHTVNADHTGDPNGYFMLVNASLQPSVFYVDTVRGLCSNTTYEFSAWVMNVILPSACNGNADQPNLNFTIETPDGLILRTYNSGIVPPTSTPLWRQKGFFFTTPATTTDLVLRIVNNAPGGCGNDLAIDDISFRPCGSKLTPTISGIDTSTVQVCNGAATSVNLSCIVGPGFLNPVYQWQQWISAGWVDIPLANTLNYTSNFAAGTPAGTYQYRLSAAEAGNLASLRCRIFSPPISIVVNNLPIPTAGSNAPVCAGATLNLTAAGGEQYSWTGPGGFSSNLANAVVANLQPGQAGTYNVTVTNAAGCSAVASTIVAVTNTVTATVAPAAVSMCAGDSVQLHASGGTAYQWLPSSGLSGSNIANPKASPASSIAYKVAVSNVSGCKDTGLVNVTVFEKAIANAGPDKAIIGGGTVQLQASISGSYQSFAWSPATAFAQPQSLEPIVTPASDALYRLTVQSNNGCGIHYDDVMVKVYKGLYIPSAFTPNNDGNNDRWNIPALDAYPNFELFVFNRYGEVVFKSTRSNRSWDGRFKGNPVPTGTYVYFIKLNVNGEQVKGTVTLFR